MNEMAQLLDAITRLERKLDTLIAALADDDEEHLTLEGDADGGERDQGQPL